MIKTINLTLPKGEHFFAAALDPSKKELLLISLVVKDKHGPSGIHITYRHDLRGNFIDRAETSANEMVRTWATPVPRITRSHIIESTETTHTFEISVGRLFKKTVITRLRSLLECLFKPAPPKGYVPPPEPIIHKEQLVASNLNGLPFMLHEKQAIEFKIPYQKMSKLTKCYRDLEIRLTFNEPEEDHDLPVCYFYALEKEDIIPLMGTLLTLDRASWIGVIHQQKWLYIKTKDVAVTHHVTIDHFFRDATPEEIEYSRF